MKEKPFFLIIEILSLSKIQKIEGRSFKQIN